ncbi:uncharacterized protein CC84DRAFT_57915 [Paraphaeosphaeria sporulosa]|uniref:Uncharacterized protein n=1 Tax=Paraphaeosphaeria sporulosa TaxID=1460663 RepID=A0A177CWD6_9PLEO|nr:uncharacterized protein CC84DRAFT_57915 [Paraphaeosphaeria sporulosa]OAG11855.1 hypothetical protein CC84DRAFT_57915 [Paraphaeosphaeria sporulosa]
MTDKTSMGRKIRMGNLESCWPRRQSYRWVHQSSHGVVHVFHLKQVRPACLREPRRTLQQYIHARTKESVHKPSRRSPGTPWVRMRASVQRLDTEWRTCILVTSHCMDHQLCPLRVVLYESTCILENLGVGKWVREQRSFTWRTSSRGWSHNAYVGPLAAQGLEQRGATIINITSLQKARCSHQEECWTSS